MSDPLPAYGVRPDDHRLPDATRLGRVRLQVADLERSLAYYRQFLGFEVLDRAEGAASLGARGGGEPLVELRERPGALPAPPHGRVGLYHFAVLLPTRADLGRFLGHLVRHGVQPGAADHLVSEALYLQDPDGLGIEVYADRPRSVWEARGLELAIGTEPLDGRGLLDAGAGEAWTGLPSGTTIGHIHLHVPDLERAAAFYHRALGLDKIAWSYPGALFLGAGGYHHHLGVNTWAGRGAEAAREEEARLLEWEVVLPAGEDVEAAARSVTGAGYGVEREGSGWTTREPAGSTLRVRREDAAGRG